MYYIKTESGARYIVVGDVVKGGSKNLKDGRLLNPPVQIGKCLLMLTPERAHLNPHYRNPGVMSTPVVEMEPIVSRSQQRRLESQLGAK
jgi:hypothetical protein